MVGQRYCAATGGYLGSGRGKRFSCFHARSRDQAQYRLIIQLYDRDGHPGRQTGYDGHIDTGCGILYVLRQGPRESRLFTSVPKFIERQLGTVIRVYAMYQPLRVFFIIGAFLIVLGFLPIASFLYFYFVADSGGGHLQSLLLGSIIMLVGFMTLVVGLVADLISFNRQMLEMILERVKRLELAAGRQTGDED